MSPEQVVAILATIADLRLNAERLAAENAELRQALAAARPPDGGVPAYA